MDNQIVLPCRVKDIAGQKFGRLTVVSFVGIEAKRVRWLCVCDCSKEMIARADMLRSGNTRSCGCLHRDYTASGAARRKHGLAGTREYRLWLGMRDRCENASNPEWGNYGGRGIKVCDRWSDFENFLADMGKRPNRNLSLDRIDNDGNYEPGNVRWATTKEQARNTRRNRVLTFRGESKPLIEWAEVQGIAAHTLHARITRLGWSVERALTEPANHELGRSSNNSTETSARSVAENVAVIEGSGLE
jgi:hypothetical protein